MIFNDIYIPVIKKKMQTLFKDYYFKLKIFIFFLLLVIIFYRSPHILLNGRFTAEEGWFWFRNSYIEGPIYGLFQVYWEVGYFNLWANIGSVLALIPSLDYAPFATVYLSLSLKLFIIYYVLNTNSSFLINIFYKILTCFIIILSPPMVPEIWLNTLNSQTYFGILTILVFFHINENKSFIDKTSPYMLLLGGLSTLYVCILSPFFLIKYLISKRKSDLKNFIFIAFATLVQSLILLYTKINALEYGYRSHYSVEKIISYCYNVITKSLLGRETSQLIIKFIGDVDKYLILSFFLIICIAVIFFIIKLTKNKKDDVLNFLIYFFIIESILVFIGSWFHQVQGRYAVVPGILLLFILIRLSQSKVQILKFFSLFFLLFSLAAGSYEFKHNSKYPNFLICNNCPIWKNEIAKWEENKNYAIKIWHYPKRSMLLK